MKTGSKKGIGLIKLAGRYPSQTFRYVLQNRWNALEASIILGMVWVVWHVPPWTQAQYTPIWVAGQCATSIGLRVLIVWFLTTRFLMI
jgi:hypothetical protein